MEATNKINIILHEPEIPQNTGNIARTCAATGAALHIIKPMGFTIDDKKLNITYYENYADFLEKHPEAIGSTYFFTTKAPQAYTEVENYPKNVFIMFGKETKGLPEDLLYENRDYCVRIPMRDTLRSLNLSNSVAIAVYEILRRWDFEGLREDGNLTSRSW